MRTPLVWYSLKNTGAFGALPAVSVGVLLPAGYLLVLRGGGTQAATIFLGLCFAWLIPALAAWWPLFVFKERIEGDGRELLYLLRRRGESSSALFLIAVYTLLLAPLMVLANRTAGVPAAEIVPVFARCGFVVALSFWACFRLGSTPLAFLAVIAFNVGLMRPFEMQLASATLPLFAGRDWLPVALVYAALSVSLLLHGESLSRVFDGQ